MKVMLIRLNCLQECIHRLQWLPAVLEINYLLKGILVEMYSVLNRVLRNHSRNLWTGCWKQLVEFFGDPQTGIPFVTHLAYENANAACCTKQRQTYMETFVFALKLGPLTIRVCPWLLPYKGPLNKQCLHRTVKLKDVFKCGDSSHF